MKKSAEQWYQCEIQELEGSEAILKQKWVVLVELLLPDVCDGKLGTTAHSLANKRKDSTAFA